MFAEYKGAGQRSMGPGLLRLLWHSSTDVLVLASDADLSRTTDEVYAI